MQTHTQREQKRGQEKDPARALSQQKHIVKRAIKYRHLYVPSDRYRHTQAYTRSYGDLGQAQDPKNLIHLLAFFLSRFNKAVCSRSPLQPVDFKEVATRSPQDTAVS